jgi:hypothetical protein
LREHKSNISASMMGKNNPMFGYIKKNSSHPNSQKIEVLDLETNISISYNSIRAAARALNCQESSIRYYFKRVAPPTKKPYKKRYVFTISKIDS